MKHQSSKPLAATVSSNANFNAPTTPMNTPIVSNMPNQPPGYGNAMMGTYPPQYAQGWPQPQPGYAPQNYAQYPPPNY